SPGRHLGSLASEDARQELRVAPPRLPGGIGEVRNLGEGVAHRAPCTVLPVALGAMLAKKRAAGGHSSCRRGRPPGGRASWGLGWLGGRTARGSRRQFVELPLQLMQFLLKTAVVFVEIGRRTAVRLGP